MNESLRHLREARLLGGHSDRPSVATLATVMFATILFLYFIRHVVLLFVVSGVVAYLCLPVIDWLTVRTHRPRWLFALAILLVLLLGAVLLALIGAPPLMGQIGSVLSDLQGTIARTAQALLGGRTVHVMGVALDPNHIATEATDALRGWLSARGTVSTLAGWVFTGLFGFVLVWVLLGYFLFDAPRISQGALWLVPPPYRPLALRVWKDLDPLLRRYFLGVALVVAYAATLAYVGLGLILGLRHAGLLALLTGFLELIPLIGPVASGVIAGLVAVQQAKSGWNILAYTIYAVALRVSIDQFFGPLVLGRAAELRPVLVIFCVLVGAVLLGTVGVILAIPCALAIKVVLAALYEPGS
jgi:predicted PurR-regulated permease PerM